MEPLKVCQSLERSSKRSAVCNTSRFQLFKLEVPRRIAVRSNLFIEVYDQGLCPLLSPNTVTDNVHATAVRHARGQSMVYRLYLLHGDGKANSEPLYSSSSLHERQQIR